MDFCWIWCRQGPSELNKKTRHWSWEAFRQIEPKKHSSGWWFQPI